jgi:hypothetical protein
MKVLPLLLLALVRLSASGQGVILGPGDSFQFEFSSLQYAGPAQNYGSSLAVDFALGSFMENESLRLELFSNTFSDTALAGTYQGTSNPNAYYGIVVVWGSPSQPYWPDLQGAVRVSMLSGSAEVTAIQIQQVVGGSLYFQRFSVPEPSALSLFAMSAVPLVLFRLRHGATADSCSSGRTDDASVPPLNQQRRAGEAADSTLEPRRRS